MADPVPVQSALTVGDLSGAVARRSNRTYQQWLPIWTKLAHAREGTGGFLDGTYLIEHPREFLDHSTEQVTVVSNGDGTTSQVKQTIPNPNASLPSPKLIRRRRLARYENVAGKIIKQMKSALFREAPTRRIGDGEEKPQPTPIEAWWKNIERAPKPGDPSMGTARSSMSQFMAQAWDSAGTFGHMFIVLDRPAGPPALTQADEALPFLRIYTPLDAVDWLTDDLGNLTEIMFVERVQRKTLDDPEAAVRYNIRRFTTEYWALYNGDMELLEGGPDKGQHKLGRLPVVVLYSHRRALIPLIGDSVLDNPQLYIDLYNLTSELRELLRNQTFGLLNVVLGTEESVSDAQTNMGRMSGTESVLFSRGKSEYISPDADNVTAYRNERNDLIRTIYRLVAIAWESDSKDAEAQGSLKLKREDLNQMLSGFADELERAEVELAELFYRARYGATAWEAPFEADAVTVRYPETFDTTPFDVVLAQAQASLALGMPPTFNRELRKRLVVKFLADAPPDLLKTINQEIDQSLQEPSPTQKLLADRMAAAQGGGAADDKTIEATKTESTTEGRMTQVDQAQV